MELKHSKWKRKILPLVIHLLVSGVFIEQQAIAATAQVRAAAGEIVNIGDLTWNGISDSVIQSQGEGAQVNVTGTGSFDLSSNANAVLIGAANGGSVSLSGGGSIKMLNTAQNIAALNSLGGYSGPTGTLFISGYNIETDNSQLPDNILESRDFMILLSNYSGRYYSEQHVIKNTTATLKGNGTVSFIEVTGYNLLLKNTTIETDNSLAAVYVEAAHSDIKSNVLIDGGRYYARNTYQDPSKSYTQSTGAALFLKDSDITLTNNAYVGSDDGGYAVNIVSGMFTANNSTISGGKAGILASYGTSQSTTGPNQMVTINTNGSLIEGREGAAILFNPHSTSTNAVRMTLTSSDTTFSGKKGFHITDRSAINATLDNSLIEATETAVDVESTNVYASTLNITLNNGSRIQAPTAFKSQGNFTLNVTADSSTLSGDLSENDDMADSTLTAVLTGGSSLTGKSTNVSSISLTDSAWNVTADSSVTTMNNDVGGNIVFVSPTNEALASDYKTLLVNGNYSGNGSIRFNTRLGDDNSLTDRMIVRGDTVNTTQVYVNNTGGSGALTDNGIQLIQVDGQSNGVFSLSNRVVAGMYQYDLFKNGDNGGWYLSSSIDPDWIDPTPTPEPSSDTDRLIAPESGVYAHNMTVAAGMFRHTMYDRMGAVHNTYGSTEGDLQPGMWIRTVGTHTDSKGGSGQLNIDTDTTVVQLGGDIAQWTNGDERLFMGLMGGYGRSTIHAKNSLKPYTNSGIKNTASGTVEGYHVGAYATWLDNQSALSGPYVDSWVQYGWFDNSVQGNGRAKESYNSRGLSASVETGYAFNVDENEALSWMLEPQAQVIYSRYRADDFNDANGTRISDGRADGFTTRLGARFYSRSKPGKEAIQPFMEVNWWNDSAQGSQRFDGEKLSDGIPNNSYELKGGVQKSIAKGWQVWGHVNGIMGKDSYSSYGATIGVKAQF